MFKREREKERDRKKETQRERGGDFKRDSFPGPVCSETLAKREIR